MTGGMLVLPEIPPTIPKNLKANPRIVHCKGQYDGWNKEGSDMRCGSGSLIQSIQTLFDSGSATGMTDRELLEQFLARRDESSAQHAFTAVVTRHGPMVWSICRSIAPDSHTAEDAFQATFLILVRSAARSGETRHSPRGCTASPGGSPFGPRPPSHGGSDTNSGARK